MPPRLADITQGQRLARIDGEGFCIHQVSYPAAREMPAHSHRAANITLVLSGGFEEQIDHTLRLCRALSVILKPAGAVHATRCENTGARSLVLELSPDLEDYARRCFGLFDNCLTLEHGGPAASHLLGLWRRLSATAASRATLPDAWITRLAEFIGARRAIPHSPGQHIRCAIQLISRTPARTSTSDLARRLDLHPVYLARLFRERTGASPTQFRVRRQVSDAVDRLLRTTDPVSRIAFATGFADQAHLTRRLKRETGLTPSALRRLAAPATIGKVRIVQERAGTVV